MSRDEVIDLNKLTNKQLTIRLLDRVTDMKEDISELKAFKDKEETKFNDLNLDFTKLKTKVKYWVATSAFVTGIIIKYLPEILK